MVQYAGYKLRPEQSRSVGKQDKRYKQCKITQLTSSTFALGIVGSGRSQEWMNKNVKNSKLGLFAKNRSKLMTRRSFHEMAIAHS